MISRLIRLVALATSLVIAFSFVAFAADQAKQGSDKQVKKLNEAAAKPDPSLSVEKRREREHSAIREAADDGNDFLLKPFNSIVDSNEPWVTRGVPTLIGLLLYGVGLSFMARYVRA